MAGFVVERLKDLTPVTEREVRWALGHIAFSSSFGLKHPVAPVLLYPQGLKPLALVRTVRVVAGDQRRARLSGSGQVGERITVRKRHSENKGLIP